MQSYRFLSIIMVYELRKKNTRIAVSSGRGCGTFGVEMLVAIRSLRILRADNFTFWCKKKVRQKFAETKKRRTFASLLKRKRGALSSAGSEHLPYKQRVGVRIPQRPPQILFLFRVIARGALSSAGSEHLPYKQRVGGSNPSAPTTQEDTWKVSFLFYVINLCFSITFLYFNMCESIK